MIDYGQHRFYFDTKLMKTATTSAVLPCTPEEFWTVFLDESFSNALYLEELEYKAFTVIESTETSRKLLILPKMNLPAVVDKLIGESFTFEDHGTLDRVKNEWTWQMVQPTKLNSRRKPRKDVVKMQGTIGIEAEGDRHCRRTDNFSVEARIFGIGGRIEASIEKELLSARTKEYAFFTEWLER